MDMLEMSKIARDALDDKFGKDIKVLDLRGLSNIADFFIIASGDNSNQLRAMADNVEEKLFKAGMNFIIRKATAAEYGYFLILAK